MGKYFSLRLFGSYFIAIACGVILIITMFSFDMFDVFDKKNFTVKNKESFKILERQDFKILIENNIKEYWGGLDERQYTEQYKKVEHSYYKNKKFNKEGICTKFFLVKGKVEKCSLGEIIDKQLIVYSLDELVKEQEKNKELIELEKEMKILVDKYNLSMDIKKDELQKMSKSLDEKSKKWSDFNRIQGILFEIMQIKRNFN